MTDQTVVNLINVTEMEWFKMISPVSVNLAILETNVRSMTVDKKAYQTTMVVVNVTLAGRGKNVIDALSDLMGSNVKPVNQTWSVTIVR